MTRRENDFYPTPPASVTELLREIAPEVTPGVVFDPAAGEGALLLEAKRIFGDEMAYRGFDICLTAEALATNLPMYETDYLAAREVGPASLYLSNPPFNLAQEFVTKMLAERGPNTIVCVLLRLNFLGSQKRETWWRGLQRPALRVLSKRPSFTGDGRTDSTEYAWYVWSPPSRSLGLAPLDWYSGRDC